MRAGRPRRAGLREKSGRVQRESKAEIQRATLVARCRVMGWPVTPDNLLRADDTRLATFPGRLYVAGHIKAREYLGIMAYEKAWNAYRQAIGAPPATARGMSLAVTGGLGSISAPFDADAHKRVCRAAENAYRNAEGALIATGRKSAVISAIEAGEEVSPCDFVQEAWRGLREAGNALARHFGV